MPSLPSLGTSTDLLTDIGGTPPSAGDSVYLGRGAQTYLTTTDQSAVDVLLWSLEPGFSGDFSEANPLKIVSNRTSTGRLRIRWSGQKSYIRSTTMAAGVIYSVVMDPSQNGIIVYKEADTEYFAQLAGTLLAESTADISKYYAWGSAIGHLLTGGPTVAEVVAGGGAVANVSRAVTLVRALQNGRVNTLETAIAPTNGYVDGGYWDHRGGNMTNLYLNGGTLDLTKSPGPITVTNRYANLPTVILLKRGTAEPTWTNKPVDLNPPEIRWV